MVRVWDVWVRVGHWLLVLCIAVAWLTRHGGGEWHEWSGYGAVAIVAARIVWGFVGSSYARFSEFVRGPKEVIAYAKDLRRRREQRYLGHTPLSGYMMIALPSAVLSTGVSGWFYSTDRYWGVAWVGELHHSLADLLMLLVALHIVGTLFACYRNDENLVAAMVHGRKRLR